MSSLNQCFFLNVALYLAKHLSTCIASGNSENPVELVNLLACLS